MPANRKRILIVGEAVAASGYATVVNGLLPHLCEFFDVHVFAIGYRGTPIEAEWHIHPNPSFRDPWGLDELPRLLREIRPAVVLFIFDLLLYLFHSQVLEEQFPEIRRIVYCPIDGTAPRPSAIAALSTAHRLVLFTETARREVTAAGPDSLPPTEVIPHGVNTEIYHPSGNRRDARRAAFPGRPDLWDGFIVLNANRNNPRKRIDLTLEGFAAFAQGKPADVALCLHLDRTEFYQVEDLARELGIPGRLIFGASGPGHATLSPEDMNVLYNACEVGINTSTGEGWGLVAFEHGATGGAQIVPRHSACAELWAGAAVFLEPVSGVRHPGALCGNETVDAKGVATALESLYSDAAQLTAYGAAAFGKATCPQYQWKSVAGRWRGLFDDILSGELLA